MWQMQFYELWLKCGVVDMKKLILNNISTFFIVLFVFSIINVIATTIQSSNVEYTTNKSVKDSVDELYERKYKYDNWVDINHISVYRNNRYHSIKFKYWNAGFNGSSYSSGQLPYTDYSDNMYDSYSELLNNSISTYKKNYFIRSLVLADSIYNSVGHTVCLFYNGNEVCLNPNFGYNLSTSQISNKLRNEMELLLRVNNASCIINANNNVTCSLGDYYCEVTNGGRDISCGDSSAYCKVTGYNGGAFCARV